jgi:predicted PurR-regulated permease PerM
MPAPSAPFWVAVTGGVLLLAILALSAHALFMFVVGVFLVMFLATPVAWLEKHGVPRPVASLLVSIMAVAAVLATLALAGRIIIEQGSDFVRSLPAMLDQIEAQYRSLELPSWLTRVIDAGVAGIERGLADTDWAAFGIGAAQGLIDAAEAVLTLSLLPVFTFYLLKDLPAIRSGLSRGVPEPWREDVDAVARIVAQDFRTYFRGELLVSSIMFVVVAVGTFLIGLAVGGPLASFALLLGLWAFVLELVPEVGPILSFIPALLLALTTSPAAVVLVSVFYFVAFNVEGSILVPMLEGRMTEFSGATVLVLIAIGFALAGILGAILAVPAGAVARDVFRYLFQRAQRESRVPPAGVLETAASGGQRPVSAMPEPPAPLGA